MATCLAVLSVIASASPATASLTIGQLGPTALPGACGTEDRLQPTVLSGNSYVVPSTGGITAWSVTSWSHNARELTGQMMTLKMFRSVGASIYQVVGHDGPRPLAPSIVNTFPAHIPVKSGDILGLNGGTGSNTSCYFNFGENDLYRPGDLSDGQAAEFTDDPGGRLNITAELVPTNTFTLGRVTRNEKKGTATLTVNVPNPGELTASGKGVKAGAAATMSSAVIPGPAQLLIKAKGKQKRKLDETGKVKVKPKITYTPGGGDPSTQATKVKLKKL